MLLDTICAKWAEKLETYFRFRAMETYHLFVNFIYIFFLIIMIHSSKRLKEKSL